MPISSALLDDSAVRVRNEDHNARRVIDLLVRKPQECPRVIVQATVAEEVERASLRAGLLASPAHTSPKFLYDREGSALFSAITELDEYYPTRTEAAIFDRHRRAIADALPRDSQWIDLGCGDAAKSRGWLEAAHVRRYIGVDIAEAWLRTTLNALAGERGSQARSPALRPPLDVLGVVTDFTRPFDIHALLAEEPGMAPVFFYPGSSIGNFARDDARAFLASVRAHLAAHPSGDGRLLIGVDLVKDRATLVAAYDDALGVTGAFGRNVLRVANRLLDADFDPAAFVHRALYDEAESRIEMRLVSLRDQTVRIGDASRRFAEGEAIVTEHSHKYTIDGFAELLTSAGFAGDARLRHWTDERDWFGVFVAEAA